MVRPVVPLLLAYDLPSLIGVVDSGSPMSVADAALFRHLGVDIESDPPLYEVPLSVGGGYSATPVFEVELLLRPPDRMAEPIGWRLTLGARRQWRLPFAVLLGQRGWFDTFPTRIDATEIAVET